MLPHRPSRADLRRLRLLQIEQEQRLDDLAALRMTEEQRQTLLRPFLTVKFEFADLDGLCWKTRPPSVHTHAPPASPIRSSTPTPLAVSIPRRSRSAPTDPLGTSTSFLSVRSPSNASVPSLVRVRARASSPSSCRRISNPRHVSSPSRPLSIPRIHIPDPVTPHNPQPAFISYTETHKDTCGSVNGAVDAGDASRDRVPPIYDYDSWTCGYASTPQSHHDAPQDGGSPGGNDTDDDDGFFLLSPDDDDPFCPLSPYLQNELPSPSEDSDTAPYTPSPQHVAFPDVARATPSSSHASTSGLSRAVPCTETTVWSPENATAWDLEFPAAWVAPSSWWEHPPSTPMQRHAMHDTLRYTYGREEDDLDDDDYLTTPTVGAWGTALRAGVAT